MWSTAAGLELAALAPPFCHLRVQDLATLIEDGKVVLYHACNWYPHKGPPLFEVQGDVSIGSVHAKVIKMSLLYS